MKPGEKREKARLTKVRVFSSDRPVAWAMLGATCCKTAGGRAGGEHVLASMSHEDREMQYSGDVALLYAPQSKAKGKPVR